MFERKLKGEGRRRGGRAAERAGGRSCRVVRREAFHDDCSEQAPLQVGPQCQAASAPALALQGRPFAACRPAAAELNPNLRSITCVALLAQGAERGPHGAARLQHAHFAPA